MYDTFLFMPRSRVKAQKKEAAARASAAAAAARKAQRAHESQTRDETETEDSISPTVENCGSAESPITVDDSESDCGYEGGVNHYVDSEDDFSDRDDDAYDLLDELLQEIDEAGLLEHNKRLGMQVQVPKANAFTRLMEAGGRVDWKEATRGIPGYDGQSDRTKRRKDKQARDQAAFNAAARSS